MRRPSRAQRRPAEANEALSNAWKLHDVQMDWTGKVDAKAAFALTVQAALLGVAVVLLEDMNIPAEYILLGISVLFIVAGAVFAAMVVAPQLRASALDAEIPENFIYFGHARGWKPQDLADKVRQTDLTDQLARQIVTMARIAWLKHRWVNLSIWFGLVGGVFLLAAGVISRLPETGATP